MTSVALRIHTCAIFALAAVLATPASADMAAALAALKQGGKVLLIRHAQTHAGTGDPADFDVADCATQRNLDHRGRDQATRLGRRLGAAGVRIDRVLSSAWCRCRDTARIILDSAGEADIAVETFEPLNSFFEDRGPAKRRVKEATSAVADWNGPGILLMSTHMVNVLGMTGRSVTSGSFFVLEPKPDGFEIVAAASPGEF